MNNKDFSDNIKQKAKELGFYSCGISKAEPLIQEAEYYKRWLKKGFHADMKFLENFYEIRINPLNLFANAKSVISVTYNYFHPENFSKKDTYKLSKYVYKEDYHYVIKSKLKELSNFINNQNSEVDIKEFCDTLPVMDKVWAKKSGLGWIGKNTCLILPKAGSYFFLGGLITNLELKYDKPIGNYCGNCNKCIEACPTNALVNPYQLDANKCIAYNTIENKNDLQDDLKLSDYIFGCDICQEVCPWNIRFSSVSNNFSIIQEVQNLKKMDWQNLDEKRFNLLFKNTVVERTGYKRLKRNIRKNFDIKIY